MQKLIVTLVVVYLFINRSAANCIIGSLDNITEAIENCQKPISKLILQNASFIVIPSQILQKNRDIIFVDISGVGLRSMEAVSFCKWSKLKSVDFSKNNLTTLPEQMLADCEPLLIDLNFSFNAITKLAQNTFTKVTSLKFIDLSWNRIESLIDDVFKPLANLETLRLDNNQISIINSDLFVHNSILKTLTLNDNILDVVQDGSFLGLKEIRTLDLSKNPELKAIDLSGMARLQRLNIESCSLSGLSVPAHGKIISAASNNISHIKVDQGNDVQWLDLSMNRIRNLSDLSLLIDLHFLDLSNNQLVDIDFSQFAMLKNLTELKIHANPIQRLDSKALCSYVPSVRAIEISADSLDRANLEESIAWFKSNNVQVTLNNEPTPNITTPDTKLGTTTMRSLSNPPFTWKTTEIHITDRIEVLESRMNEIQAKLNGLMIGIIVSLSLFTSILIFMFIKQYANNLKFPKNLWRRNIRHEPFDNQLEAEETV